MLNGIIQIHSTSLSSYFNVTVDVARTRAELTSGYSNTPEPGVGNGILFDIGGSLGVRSSSGINLSSMLFNLDIISIDEVVIDGVPRRYITNIQQNLAPRQTGITVSNVRYFLETPAGYPVSAGIQEGDEVIFSSAINTELSESSSSSTSLLSGDLLESMITMMIVMMMMKMMSGMMNNMDGASVGSSKKLKV